jgi:hypothetical protein
MALATSRNRCFFSIFQTHSFLRQDIILVFFLFFCSQIWSATGSLSGSFATFAPNLKIFLHSFAFLDFSMQIYFQQSSLWVGLTGWLERLATLD